jgi:hypothetical protein
VGRALDVYLWGADVYLWGANESGTEEERVAA